MILLPVEKIVSATIESQLYDYLLCELLTFYCATKSKTSDRPTKNFKTRLVHTESIFTYSHIKGYIQFKKKGEAEALDSIGA